MATKHNYIGIEKFAPFLIKKAAIIDSGVAEYHQVPNVLPSNSYVLPIVKPSLKYNTGSNQQAAFSQNSSMQFDELQIGVDRLEINLEVSKDAVRDAVYSSLLSDVDGRRPEDLSEHEFKAEVLTYFGRLVKRQMLADLDKFLICGKDVFGSHLAKITSNYSNFKMTGLLSGANVDLASERITLINASNGVSITASKTVQPNGTEKVVLSLSVPTATVDLSYLKSKRNISVFDVDGVGVIPFDARIVAPYNVSGGNQTFAIEFFAPAGYTYNQVDLVKDDNFEKKLQAAASFAAELEALGGADVRLVMNSSEFLRYNQLVHAGIALPTDTVNRYQGFQITVIPAMQNGILVATKEACHVVSGAAANDVQGEDLQIYDLSIIGEKKYRARLSVMVGAMAQYEYTTLFV
ncbi:MAG: hypothetical protein KatS3mg087_1890 [Patescibacteria group bacterium]|nr:MAG: hypothetical protein KatS3mg087_1890 [Patescibacteria group bacterium]